MGPLLTILARQTMLKKLCMSGNRLIDAQIDQILQVVTQTAPSCQLEGEIKIWEPNAQNKGAKDEESKQVERIIPDTERIPVVEQQEEPVLEKAIEKKSKWVQPKRHKTSACR